jgi:TolA-binding protein
MRKIQLLVALLLIAGAALVAAQSANPQDILQKGKQEYQRTEYRAALQDFRDIILNPKYSALHGDAYYWVSLSYIALNQLPDAEKNLEYFLLNYPDNPNVSDAYYQKGRLLFLQNEYQKSIQVLYTFIKSYKDNPYVANAYYWIGESLYNLGHFQDAQKVFQVVVSQYPTSYKVEAAKYRLSVINLKQRELELMKLLRWSHEEALKAQEDFNQKEQAYEQAIIAYQRKIANLQNSSETSAAPAPSSTDQQISALKDQISQLQSQIQSLGTVPATASTSGGVNTSQNLLALEAEALNLKQFYLNWLSSHPGASQ